MPYAAQITRAQPTALLFLVDQSGSMHDQMAIRKPKAQQVADVFNRTLASLIIRCTAADGVRDYFEIGVIGYGGQAPGNALQGPLGGPILHSISEVEGATLRIEERQKRTDDGAGGLVEVPVKFPVWLEPRADGGTPMCQAITHAAEELVAWCDAHPDSYPPTVLHITDGESTDGDPEALADQLRQIATADGSVLMFNLHVSTSAGSAIAFPSSDAGLPDAYAKLLFRMSSPLPGHLVDFARNKGFTVNSESRGFMFNAEAEQIVDFFDIGTKAAQL